MAVESPKRPSGMAGMSFRHSTLILLTIQSSVLILILHYSRVMTPVHGHRYAPSTALLMSEVMKLTVSLTMALYEIATHPRTPDTSTAAGLFGDLLRVVFAGDSWKLIITATLYALQNSLQFVAVGNLDAATFQATSQLKILTTAMFSTILLGRVFNARRWLSLILLTLGVAIIHIPGGAQSSVLSIKDLRMGTPFEEIHNIWDLKAISAAAAGQLSKRSATYEGIDEDHFGGTKPEGYTSIGLTTLAMACLTSSLASVYFEKILKEPKSDPLASVWVRNVQLSFYSILATLLVGILFQDGERISANGFFAGYNWIVWTAILVQAGGGILISFVIKFADNIAKNFAMSLGILLSFFVSVFLFDFEVTSFYVIGTIIVLSTTYLYYYVPEASKLKPPQIRIPDSDEKSAPAYFDLESIPTPARSPLRGNEALSTSRPGTPTYERLSIKNKSPDLRSKREQ